MDEQPREPDYRFTLANERTLLAWIRTVLALDAAGLGVIRFGPPLWFGGGREAAGIVLILLGSVTAGGGYRRWVRVDRAIRAGEPLPPSSLPRLLSVSLAALSLLLVPLLLVERLRRGG